MCTNFLLPIMLFGSASSKIKTCFSLSVTAKSNGNNEI